MNSTHRDSFANRIPYGRYCLYCFAPMKRTNSVVDNCPRCDRLIVRLDRESRWTLEPVFVLTERVLVFSIWTACILFGAISATANLGFSLGYLVGLPAVGGMLHFTAIKLTHRVNGVRFDLLWAIVAPGFVFAAGGSIFLFMAGRESETPAPAFLEEIVPPIWTALLFASPIAAFYLARMIERWKARRIHRRMRSYSDQES